METKKSENAKIENKRSSFLMIGMVCAMSTALMSFEYSNYTLHSNDLAGINVEEDIWELPLVEPIIMQQQQQELPKEVNKEEILVSPDPEPIPDPNPLPDPNPDPIPFPIPDPLPVPIPVVQPKIDDHVYEVVEEMPEFPGGMDAMYSYLSSNLKYPQISKEIGSEGKAYVRFTVEKDGTISAVEVVKGVDKYIDKEASRVVGEMPKWKPGKQLNKAVRVSFVLPINFEMN